MTMRFWKLGTLFLFIWILSILPRTVLAVDNLKCNNRYATIINPVRGRNLWKNKTLQPLIDQYREISKYNFAATWLVQYDTFNDREVVSTIKSFNSEQEIGVFLEVSEQLAEDSGVVYPKNTVWYSPNVVFLSGYSRQDRVRLIDKLMTNFHTIYGYYPKSVGAWWIDSFSLHYLTEKYGVRSTLIVADQKTTDNYGIWGQWWGVPYYPDKVNVLVPSKSAQNQEDTVVLQWAQRDLLRAYGVGWTYSNYSLQANDYIRLGETTNYFEQLVKKYLSCQNTIGQITVGLETGIESVGYIGEYEKQMKVIAKLGDVKTVTMNRFYTLFKSAQPFNPKQLILGEGSEQWNLSLEGRKNEQLGDIVSYRSGIAFADFFIADHKAFLDRNVDNLKVNLNQFPAPWWIMLGIVAITFLWFYDKRLIIVGGLFGWFCYGLVWRSFYGDGWIVYFGPVIEQLWLAQLVMVILILAFIICYRKVTKTWWKLLLLPATYSFDYLLSNLRFSVLSGKYYFGMLIKSFTFLGFSTTKSAHLEWINQRILGYQAEALLKCDFEKIWNNLALSSLVYPLIHIGIAMILGVLFRKLPHRIRWILITLMLLAGLGWGWYILQSNPRIVLPNT